MSTVRDIPLIGLIVRPHPNLTESWPGYLARLAFMNEIPGIGKLARVLGTTEKSLLYGSLSADAEGFCRFHVQDHAGHRWPRNARSHHMRICPSCAAAGRMVVQAIWDRPLAVHCPVHQCFLVSHCPQCSRPLSHLRTKANECECGLSFRQFDIESVSPWVDRMNMGYRDTIPSEASWQCAPSTASERSLASLLSDFARSHNTGVWQASRGTKTIAMLARDSFDALQELFERCATGASAEFLEWYVTRPTSVVSSSCKAFRIREFSVLRERLLTLRSIPILDRNNDVFHDTRAIRAT